ncbi:hypothetical protein NCAS_0D00480 [Naumovozyma castellii]|uniref:Protein DSE2 n=1 Tax=Naumovozyma castellii TaxID=27288 RepID=G0VF10_NAUCA|nr:hypothetical protein NCAS_0D00480 [Naumovozyma castellii CBS 4309]CCC69629.1 hypothetical protein NCAS_0D00480 [Naumovozyma castellii CBS 4309]
MNCKLFFITTLFSFLLSVVGATDAKQNAIKFITSNGVVYSYAVRTKTLRPATVIVKTIEYTTTRVRQITLENSSLTSTTDTYTVASTITTSSIETPSVTASLLEVTDSHSTYSSEKPLATFSLLDDASKVATTSTVVSTPSTTKTLSPAKSTDSSISSVTSAATMPKPSRITSTLEPSGTTTTTSYTTTTTTSSSSTPTSLYQENGTCYLDYDGNDEYYSTVYITGPSQSVDAATTMTSTKIKYLTLTL